MEEARWEPHRSGNRGSGWHGHRDRDRDFGHGRDPFGLGGAYHAGQPDVRAHGWRGRWSGEPLRREPDDRLAGGVAAGLARWRGFNPTTVRIVFVVAGLFQGLAVALYCIAWLLIPPGGGSGGHQEADGPGGPASIASRARHDSRGIALAVGAASLLSVILLVTGILTNGLLASWGWPQVISTACLVLIWRNAPAQEQAAMRRMLAPLENLGPGASRRGTALRLALGSVALVAGVGLLLSEHQSHVLLRPLAGVVLVLAALVLYFGAWWLRIARDLVVERQARARAEERADIAARVHDSVLQTLALIQRRADDPAQVTQLARAQERELRSWLFEGRAPGTADAASFAEGVRQIQQDVEARHGVPLEVVTVGDCPLNDDLDALLAAAREAAVNAAKWSGASVISVFAEVCPEEIEMVVRDRGRGFDPSAVPGDRKGMAESIHGRMARHGGRVTVSTAIGEGTKVSLTMPRTAAGKPAGAGKAGSPVSGEPAPGGFGGTGSPPGPGGHRGVGPRGQAEPSGGKQGAAGRLA